MEAASTLDGAPVDASWPAALDAARPVAVMDAQCGLCAKAARWIARNDWREEFQIVPIQSPFGRTLAQSHAVDPDDPATWLVLVNGQGLSGLDAVIWCGKRFGGIWSALRLLGLLPGPLARLIYAAIARNRYSVFGRTDLCALPDPEVKARLVGVVP